MRDIEIIEKVRDRFWARPTIYHWVEAKSGRTECFIRVLVRYTRWLTLSQIRQRIEGIKFDDDEIDEYAKDPEARGYPIKSGWLTDEIMEHIKDIIQAYQQKILKELE